MLPQWYSVLEPVCAGDSRWRRSWFQAYLPGRVTFHPMAQVEPSRVSPAPAANQIRRSSDYGASVAGGDAILLESSMRSKAGRAACTVFFGPKNLK